MNCDKLVTLILTHLKQASVMIEEVFKCKKGVSLSLKQHYYIERGRLCNAFQIHLYLDLFIFND